MAYDLPSLIRSVPDFAKKTPAECRTYFAESFVTLRTARQNGNDIMKLLGVVPANMLAAALQTQGLVLVVGQLATEDGIDFGDTVTQGMLDTLGENETFAPYVSRLKALGQDTRTRWERAGGTGEIPSVEAIASAKATILLQAAWADAVNEQFSPLAASGDSIGLKVALLAFAETL